MNDQKKPPDFMIDTVSVNFRSREQEAASRTTIDTLTTFYQQEQAKRLHKAAESGATGGTGADDGSSEGMLGTKNRHHAGFISATSILTQRMFKNAVRQRGAYLNRVMGPFVITLVVALFYWGLEDTPDGLLNRLGLFHQLMGGALSGLIIHLEVFPKEVNTQAQLVLHCVSFNSFHLSLANLWRFILSLLTYYRAELRSGKCRTEATAHRHSCSPTCSTSSR